MKSQSSVQKSSALGYGLGFVGVAIFSASLPVTAFAVRELDPFFVTFARATLAAILAAIVLVALRRPFPRQHFWKLLIAGITTVFGFPLLSAFAMQTVPANHGGVVLGILPLLTAVFATIIAGERQTWVFWGSAVAGAALVVTFALSDQPTFQLSVGDAYLFLACLIVTIGYVLFGQVSRDMPGWESTSWAMVLVSPASLALLLWSHDGASMAAVSWNAWLAVFWLGAMSQYIGFFAWNAGLALGGIGRVGQLQLLQSFMTIGVSALLLSEAISTKTLVFASAVGFVVLMGSRARNAAKPK
ncbi:MAG: DMT family transporter [Notoacmeibacter sp.]